MQDIVYTHQIDFKLKYSQASRRRKTKSKFQICKFISATKSYSFLGITHPIKPCGNFQKSLTIEKLNKQNVGFTLNTGHWFMTPLSQVMKYQDKHLTNIFRVYMKQNMQFNTLMPKLIKFHCLFYTLPQNCVSFIQSRSSYLNLESLSQNYITFY